MNTKKKKNTPVHIQQAISKPSKPEYPCLTICAPALCHTVPGTQILTVLYSLRVSSPLKPLPLIPEALQSVRALVPSLQSLTFSSNGHTISNVKIATWFSVR